MKRKFGFLFLCSSLIGSVGFSQLQRGNYLIGADMANMDLNLNTGGNFSLGI